MAGAALCIAASGAVAEPAGARPDVPTVTGISHIERADGPDLVLEIVLLELCFLDDPEDGRRLGDPDWLARTAGAVADGAAEWRSADSPGFVAPR